MHLLLLDATRDIFPFYIKNMGLILNLNFYLKFLIEFSEINLSNIIFEFTNSVDITADNTAIRTYIIVPFQSSNYRTSTAVQQHKTYQKQKSISTC